MFYLQQLANIHSNVMYRHLLCAHLSKVFSCNWNFLKAAFAKKFTNMTKDDQYGVRNVSDDGNQQRSFFKRFRVFHLQLQSF